MDDKQDQRRQHTFDYVVSNLLRQGEPSINSYGHCAYQAYRDGKVLKCAAGWCIPDWAYTDSIEGLNITDKKVRQHVDNQFDVSMLAALQVLHDEPWLFVDAKCHDRPFTTRNWLYYFREGAKQYAHDHQLDSSVLNTPADDSTHDGNR